jgi:hypothetical protein
VHTEAAVESGDTIGEAAQARAVGIGAPCAVVAHLDKEITVEPTGANADFRVWTRGSVA